MSLGALRAKGRRSGMVRGKKAGTLHYMVELVDDDKRQSSLLAVSMELSLLLWSRI